MTIDYPRFAHPEHPELFCQPILVSKPTNGARPIVTIHGHYPRPIHGEILTHRKFGRNARSSRAVPVRKMLEEVRTIPYMPWHWGRNQKGMQADGECNDLLSLAFGGPTRGSMLLTREKAWLRQRDQAADMAEAYMNAGYHKQNPNRLLEPFSWMHTLITSTSWANFRHLRDHKDAEPHFQDFARLVVQALEWIRKEGAFQTLEPGEWHLPYIRESDRHEWIYGDGLAAQEIMDGLGVDGHEILRRISSARCARISYEPFDGDGSPERELERFDQLVASDRIHASPTEHQATPDGRPSYGEGIDPEGRPEWLNPHLGGNLGPGWIQFRKTIVGEYIEDEDWL